MRVIVRWVERLLLVPTEEWCKARVDMHRSQAVHSVEAAIGSEVRIFRRSLAGLKQLDVEAARAMQQSPASADLIVALLKERMQALRSSVHEAASQRTAA